LLTHCGYGACFRQRFYAKYDIIYLKAVFVVQIPTSQTSCLGGDRRYMKQFLSIIESRINSRVIDTTLKFTLSALWNLSGNVSSVAAGL